MLSKLAPTTRDERAAARARNLACERRMSTAVTELSEAALKLELEVRSAFAHEEDRHDDDDGSNAAYRHSILKKVERISRDAVYLYDTWEDAFRINSMFVLQRVRDRAHVVADELQQQYCHLPGLARVISKKCSQLESMNSELEHEGEPEEGEGEEEEGDGSYKRRKKELSEAIEETKEVLAKLEEELRSM